MPHAQCIQARPREWEERALRVLLALAAKPLQPPPRLHVLRFTDAASADALGAARRELPTDDAASADGRSTRLSVSSSPHYLMFEAEGVVRGDTRFKCAPPLRGSRNRDMLWRALADGTVDFLASDHTPTTLEMRAGSFLDAFTGISGLQFTLPATWSEAAQHGATLSNLSKVSTDVSM
jgi:allantoinase